MPNNTARSLDATPPMPPAHELRTAAALGMTWLRWCAAGKPVSKTPAGKQEPRIRPYAPYRSKWEHAYASHLDFEKWIGDIADWAYEPQKLEIGIGAKYTPDFRVVQTDGAIEFHEVKGHRREAAIVRIKSAAKQYPEFTFVLVTKKDGQWHYTTISRGA